MKFIELEGLLLIMREVETINSRQFMLVGWTLQQWLSLSLTGFNFKKVFIFPSGNHVRRKIKGKPQSQPHNGE